MRIYTLEGFLLGRRAGPDLRNLPYQTFNVS
jgi:hypothetical protein